MMLRRHGETGQPRGPFFEISVLRLAVFEDLVLCGGYTRGDGRMVRCAVGAGILNIVACEGEGGLITWLPFACAELFKIGHGNVVIGVRAHAINHNDKCLWLKLFLRGKRCDTGGQ